jgi:hypothetical protein
MATGLPPLVIGDGGTVMPAAMLAPPGTSSPAYLAMSISFQVNTKFEALLATP